MGAERHIGRRIAEIRKQKGLTQKYVAGRLGKTPQWLSNIEREIRPISADELAKLAVILDVEPGNFFANNYNKTLRDVNQ
jgi:transcriptional regulator with XRE-family HTH domain